MSSRVGLNWMDAIVTNLDIAAEIFQDNVKSIVDRCKAKHEQQEGDAIGDTITKAAAKSLRQALAQLIENIISSDEDLGIEFFKRFKEELFRPTLHIHSSYLNLESRFPTDKSKVKTEKVKDSQSALKKPQQPAPLSIPPPPQSNVPAASTLVFDEENEADVEFTGVKIEVGNQLVDIDDAQSNKKDEDKEEDKSQEDMELGDENEANDQQHSMPPPPASVNQEGENANETNVNQETEQGNPPPAEDFNFKIPSPPPTVRVPRSRSQIQRQQQGSNPPASDPSAKKVPIEYKREYPGETLSFQANDLEIIDGEVASSSSALRRENAKNNKKSKGKKPKEGKLKNNCLDSSSESENDEDKKKKKGVKERAQRAQRRSARLQKLNSEEEEEEEEEKYNAKKDPKLRMKARVCIPDLPRKYRILLKLNKYKRITLRTRHEPDSEIGDAKKAIKDLKRSGDPIINKKKKKEKKESPKPTHNRNLRKRPAKGPNYVGEMHSSGESGDEGIGNTNRFGAMGLYGMDNSDVKEVGIVKDDGGDEGFLDEPIVPLTSEEMRKKVLFDSDTDGESKKVVVVKKKEEDKPAKSRAKRKYLYVPSYADLYIAYTGPQSSDDENIKPTQKVKRRRVISSGSESDRPKKKRRPADRMTASSDSDSDIQEIPYKTKKPKAKPNENNENAKSNAEVIELEKDENEQPSQGRSRRNIREIMDPDHLQRSTRDAAREEELRKRRIAHKTRNLEQVRSKESDDALILDINPTTKKPTVIVHPELTKLLKDHQKAGISFLWNSTFESIGSRKKGFGCILAHCMGLGKTLQTIAYIYTVLSEAKLKMKRVLVVCPLPTVLNWTAEFDKWLENIEGWKPKVFNLSVNISEDNTRKKKAKLVQEWVENGGVGIIHYNGLQTLASNRKKSKISEEYLKIFRSAFLKPGPDIIVCDEGHILKNPRTQLSTLLQEVSTKRRIILTGTPMQNNLEEYYTMVNFVKPWLLGSYKEFRNRFMNPISNGQHKDSSNEDVQVMKKRAHVLHKLLDSSIQRLDYTVLKPFLPPKEEFVIHINLSAKQIQLYQLYLNFVRPADQSEKHKNFLRDYQHVQRIITHPCAIQTGKKRDEIPKAEESIEIRESQVEDDSEIEWLDEESNKIEKVNIKGKLPNPIKVKEEAKSDGEGSGVSENGKKQPEASSKGWWGDALPIGKDENLFELSGKFFIFRKILEECERMGEKLVVFSDYTTTLDWLERALKVIDSETKHNLMPGVFKDDIKRWKKNHDYYRMDGNLKAPDRSKKVNKFNEPGSRPRLFLITKGSGGIGINLIGASRVIIFDVAFNPTVDQQSLFRLYRFGQTKPVYVYRFLATGTMEAKSYNRSVVKLSLACRVVDEQQIERHFKPEDLVEMYKFKPEEKSTDIPLVPKDELLAKLLVAHKEWIDSYITHDSLLENKIDEGLTEEERLSAWDDFKTEQVQKSKAINGELSAEIRNMVLAAYRQANEDNEPDEMQLREMMDIAAVKLDYLKKIDIILNDSTNNFSSEQRQTIEGKKAKILESLNNLCGSGGGYQDNDIMDDGGEDEMAEIMEILNSVQRAAPNTPNLLRENNGNHAQINFPIPKPPSLYQPSPPQFIRQIQPPQAFIDQMNGDFGQLGGPNPQPPGAFLPQPIWPQQYYPPPPLFHRYAQ